MISLGPTLQDIRFQLAEEERQQAREIRVQEREQEQREGLEVAARDTTPGQYIFLLLEVEDQQ